MIELCLSLFFGLLALAAIAKGYPTTAREEAENAVILMLEDDEYSDWGW